MKTAPGFVVSRIEASVSAFFRGVRCCVHVKRAARIE
jgi:hypothetical protein